MRDSSNENSTCSDGNKNKDENLGWRMNKIGDENRSKGDLNCQTIKTALIKSKRKMKIWNPD